MKNNKNELIFVIYMFLFVMIRPVLLVITSSTLLLFGCVTAICYLSFIYSAKSKRNLNKCVIIVFFVVSIILFDWLIRNNGMQKEELYNFIINGIIPLFLLRNVRNYRAVLKYFCNFSIISGILYLMDPFMGYKLIGDYMSFGFSAMLPAFCGAVISYLYFSNKKMILLVICFLGEIFLFAGKSSSICAFVFMIVAYIFFNRQKKIRWRRLGIISLLSIIVIVFRNNIIGFAMNIVSKFGLYSYGLTTFKMILTGNKQEVFNARLNIWNQVIDLIKENWLFGKGIGYLESTGGSSTGYAHNVFLEIFLSFGVIFGVLFIFVLIKSFFRIKRFNDYNRTVFTLTVLILWFIPMQFSLSFWKVMTFWIYWGLCFYGIGYNYRMKESGIYKIKDDN